MNNSLYWWWIESGSLFAAYFFMSCVGAWAIVQRLDDLYHKERTPVVIFSREEIQAKLELKDEFSAALEKALASLKDSKLYVIH